MTPCGTDRLPKDMKIAFGVLNGEGMPDDFAKFPGLPKGKHHKKPGGDKPKNNQDNKDHPRKDHNDDQKHDQKDGQRGDQKKHTDDHRKGDDKNDHCPRKDGKEKRASKSTSCIIMSLPLSLVQALIVHAVDKGEGPAGDDCKEDENKDPNKRKHGKTQITASIAKTTHVKVDCLGAHWPQGKSVPFSVFLEASNQDARGSLCALPLCHCTRTLGRAQRFCVQR